MSTAEINTESKAEVERLKQQGHSALAEVFEANRDRLISQINARISSKLRGRIDASDIIQETFVEAVSRLEAYIKDPSMPLFNWISFLARQNVHRSYRYNCGTKKRDAGQEVGGQYHDDFDQLHLLAESMIGPGSLIAQLDLAERVRKTLEQMSEVDRAILTLRHIEELSIAEAAEILEIAVEAAKKRHLRALRKLQALCQNLNESTIQR